MILMEGLKMKQISRSAQDFMRKFGIDPLRRFLPDEKIKAITGNQEGPG